MRAPLDFCVSLLLLFLLLFRLDILFPYGLTILGGMSEARADPLGAPERGLFFLVFDPFIYYFPKINIKLIFTTIKS